MTGPTLFAAILILVTLAAAFAIVTIAARRSDSEGSVTASELDRRAAKADRERRKAMAAGAVSGQPFDLHFRHARVVLQLEGLQWQARGRHRAHPSQEMGLGRRPCRPPRRRPGHRSAR